jgi:hypothetical protein
VHQVAGQIAPQTRVAYVDNDPIVHVHANALLTGTGTTSIVLADLREPEAILAHPKVCALIDFREPVALLLVAITHFLTAAEDPARIIAVFRDALPDGSYLALSHATGDFRPDAAQNAAAVYDQATSAVTLRSHAQVAALFSGWDLVEPGLVPAVLAFVLAGVAPLTVAAGLVPTAYGVTGLTAIPAAFLVVAVILGVFATGYMAMSRHLTNAGAFYAFVSAGLGRPAGVAAALMALLSYSCLQIALYGMLGPQAAAMADAHLGVHGPWWAFALGAWAIVAVLGLLRVDITGRVRSGQSLAVRRNWP